MYSQGPHATIFVFPLCGFSLSLFCNYNNEPYTEATKQPSNSTESC